MCRCLLKVLVNDSFLFTKNSRGFINVQYTHYMVYHSDTHEFAAYVIIALNCIQHHYIHTKALQWVTTACTCDNNPRMCVSPHKSTTSIGIALERQPPFHFYHKCQKKGIDVPLTSCINCSNPPQEMWNIREDTKGWN